MKIIILGSGTSTGVPEIGCTCEVCTSTDPKDKRMRTSVLLKTEGKTILLDCGPDFRTQILDQEFTKIDGVLISHEHYDHVGGLDDLRPFCRFGEVVVHADKYTTDHLTMRMPYCFRENKYPGVPIISLSTVNPSQEFYIDGLKVIPVQVMHGRLPILGYRIGKMAYITDMLTMPEAEYDKLRDLDCLIINALRIQHHDTHQTLEKALENAKRINARRTYFIHMSHHIGLHREVEKMLPENIYLTYDGMEISVD